MDDFVSLKHFGANIKVKCNRYNMKSIQTLQCERNNHWKPKGTTRVILCEVVGGIVEKGRGK